MFLLFFLDESLQGFVYGRLLSDLPVYRHQTVKKNRFSTMAHFLNDPRLLAKVISEKKQQLQAIQEDLAVLPLDHTSRTRLLERMLYLQNGIPALEEQMAKLVSETIEPSASVELERVERSRTIDGQPSDVVHLSKGVREGKTVCLLYDQLKRIRSTYRHKGWTSSQIFDNSDPKVATTREWIDRISDQAHKAGFLKVSEWEDGDQFVFLQIAGLYQYTSHLKRKPSWSTVRDWRKAYLGHLRHNTRDGRKPKQ